MPDVLDPHFHGPRRTICEVLRDIHRSAEEPGTVKTLAEEAYSLAKRMDRRLREYRADWDAGFWDQVVSPEHARTQREAHERLERYGVHGRRWPPLILKALRPGWSVLDYGCGKGTFAEAMAGSRHIIREYDPGIPGKSDPPVPADFVVCTDVLPFVEIERLPDVIAHIARLAVRGGFIAIPFHPAEKLLDGGLPYINQPEAWWREQLAAIPGVQFEMLTGEGRTPYLLARWTVA